MWNEKRSEHDPHRTENLRDSQRKSMLQKILRRSNQRGRRKTGRVCQNRNQWKDVEKKEWSATTNARVQMRLKFIAFSSKEFVADWLRAIFAGKAGSETI